MTFKQYLENATNDLKGTNKDIEAQKQQRNDFKNQLELLMKK